MERLESQTEHGYETPGAVQFSVFLANPSAMMDICRWLFPAEVDVHFAYPLAVRSDANAIMVFHVDDPVTAREVLLKHGLALLGDQDLADAT